MLSIVAQVVFAYYVADLLAALFHFFTDRGWGAPKIVADFQKHHRLPHTMTFDLSPLPVGAAIAAVGILQAPWFFAPLGLFLAFGQVPHYFTHHPAPRFVRELQQLCVFLPPAAHAAHHRAPHARDFSVINGWSNPLLNWILSKAGY